MALSGSTVFSLPLADRLTVSLLVLRIWIFRVSLVRSFTSWPLSSSRTIGHKVQVLLVKVSSGRTTVNSLVSAS